MNDVAAKSVGRRSRLQVLQAVDLSEDYLGLPKTSWLTRPFRRVNPGARTRLEPLRTNPAAGLCREQLRRANAYPASWAPHHR